VCDPREILPRTVRALERGMREGLHVGAQLYLSRSGRMLADFALGEARPGVAMTPDSLVLWLCGSKPVGAVAVGRLWEQGLLEPDDRVSRFIPEFAAEGKEAITLRHLLTHTAGLHNALGVGGSWAYLIAFPWQEMLARICAAPLAPGWVPGKRASYDAACAWFVLGEVVRRADGREFGRYVREEIFEPLGMRDSWFGVPPERYHAYGERVSVLHNTAGPAAVPLSALVSESAAQRVVPGGGGAGPMHDLARFYEMLLCGGQRDGVYLLSPQVAAAIAARQRTALVDESFGVRMDWGLGLVIDDISAGRHRSGRAFGQGGAESSTVVADPDHGLVVAVAFNGMPGVMRHFRRSHAVTTAIYDDLDLVRADGPVEVDA
jgi:CubicO group peptidase (beta-lactamase class C family)